MRRITDFLELVFVIGMVIACHAVKKSDIIYICRLLINKAIVDAGDSMPENTIPAMIKAFDLGVTTLEMDVVITKDKQVLLSHEPFFGHEISTPSETVNLWRVLRKENSTFISSPTIETQQFDVGIKPHPRFLQQQKMPVKKPLLIDVIDSVENYCRNRKLAIAFL